MTGPDGIEVRCFYRRAANLASGDYLPDYSGHVIGGPVTDPETGEHWVTLDTGADVSFTPRRKVWIFRRYEAPEWMREAVENYRAARDAREAMRESSAPAPTSVAGAAGSLVAWCQLERSDFDAAYPAPRLADFVREAAAARREVAA